MFRKLFGSKSHDVLKVKQEVVNERHKKVEITQRIQEDIRKLEENIQSIQALLTYLRMKHVENLATTVNDLEALLEHAQSHRRGNLISRTVGVSVSGSGVALSILGAVLVPFTFGASLILSGAGVIMTVGGGATSIITDAVDSLLTKGDLERLQQTVDSSIGILEEFPELMDNAAGSRDVLQNVWKYFEAWRQLQIASVQESDEEVRVSDLKEGDHIYRSVFNTSIYHHGICAKKSGRLGVIDFGQKDAVYNNKVVWKTLKQFQDDGKGAIFRRNYVFPLPTKQTLELAWKAESGLLDGFPLNYNLLTRNCEHFATFCKIGEARCAQWVRWARMGKSVITGMQKTGVAMKVAGTATKVAQVTGTVAKAAGTTVMVVGAGLGAVTVVLDIALLVSDYKRERPNVFNVKVALEGFQSMEALLKEAIRELQSALEELHQSLDEKCSPLCLVELQFN